MGDLITTNVVSVSQCCGGWVRVESGISICDKCNTPCGTMPEAVRNKIVAVARESERTLIFNTIRLMNEGAKFAELYKVAIAEKGDE